MEEGQIRWDANISVRPAGSEQLGTRTELKNMNSFRFLQQALEAEMPAPDRRPRSGRHGSSRRRCTSTRRPAITTPLRSKEEAHDYRYFPEPDLVPLTVDDAWVDELRARAAGAAGGARRALHRPVRPVALRRRGARPARPTWRDFYEERRRSGDRTQAAANWVMGEYSAHLNAARPRARPRPRHRRRGWPARCAS